MKFSNQSKEHSTFPLIMDDALTRSGLILRRRKGVGNFLKGVPSFSYGHTRWEEVVGPCEGVECWVGKVVVVVWEELPLQIKPPSLNYYFGLPHVLSI